MLKVKGNNTTIFVDSIKTVLYKKSINIYAYIFEEKRRKLKPDNFETKAKAIP